MITFYISMLTINAVSLVTGAVMRTKGWWVGFIGILLFSYLYVMELKG